MSVQHTDRDRRSWTMCLLLRIRWSPRQARAHCVSDRPVNTLGDEFGIAADLDEPGGVVGVDEEQADLLVAEQVAALLPLQRRVHQRTPAVQVGPHHGRLRPAVGTQRGEYTADRPGQQIQVRGRYRKRSGRDGTGPVLPFLPVA